MEVIGNIIAGVISGLLLIAGVLLLIGCYSMFAYYPL
jgi:hypothetical protein